MTEGPDLLRCFFDMIESIPHRTPAMFDLVLKLHVFANRVRDYARSSLISAYTNLINRDFLLDNFDKWRELWLANLDSRNRRAFLTMFYEALRDNISAFREDHLQSVLELLLQKHEETLPVELLKLASLDPDFELKLQDLPSSPTSKSDLIELPLEKDAYEYCCIFHLAILRLFKLAIEKRQLSRTQLQNIEVAAKRSFEVASQFNQRVLLRYFLWKNGTVSPLRRLHERPERIAGAPQAVPAVPRYPRGSARQGRA